MREAPVHTNWATSAQYRAVGEWLKANHGGKSGVPKNLFETGTLVYYCDCILRDDDFGDRTWLTRWVTRSQSGTNLRSFLIKVNYFFYQAQPPFPPPQYTLTYEVSPTDPDPSLPYWEISSRWQRSGRITFVPK